MPGKKIRDKGGRGEREIVALFKKYWPEAGDKFRKSGAGFKGKDILGPDDFPYTVEVKNRSDIKIKHLWFPNSVLKQCLKQACQQAAAENKPWLLFVKSERIWFVITECELLEDPQSVSVLHERTYDVYPAEEFLQEIVSQNQTT